MRLLLDARLGVGGVARYAGDLIQGLGDDPEIEVHVARPSGNPAQRAFTPWGRGVVGRMARRLDVDIVHGLHFELPRATGRPLVVTMPDAIPLEHPPSMPNPLRRAYFRSILKRSSDRASLIITPSRISADSLARHGVPAKKIETIPLGMGEGFRPGSDDEVASARARFAGGSRYVAIVADDRPHKNLEVLPAVASKLPEVTVVCRGSSKNSLPGVTVLPPLTDEYLRLLYVGADALLMPSLVEGFGLPMLEALACGTPSVCGPNVGVLEYVDDAVVEVDVRSADDIADGLRSIIENTDVRDRLTANGLMHARSLTSRKMAQATASLYRRVIG